MNKTQLRVKTVLERIMEQVLEDEKEAEQYSIELDSMLGTLLSEDFFGTEGQKDPRGDERDGIWSMQRVQGIDEPHDE